MTEPEGKPIPFKGPHNPLYLGPIPTPGSPKGRPRVMKPCGPMWPNPPRGPKPWRYPDEI